MDSDSKRVLESSNMNEKKLIASTTKIMTAIVAIENIKLNKKIKVGDEISEAYGSMLYIKKGDILTVEDLLYGLLLQSGNDAAVVLANSISYDNFINLMNKKALEIGMYNTTFENPHGLDEQTKNYSTAYDLALLMQYAMQSSTFRTITSTKKYRVETNLDTYIWYNKNHLLDSYKYATGGKIGYTTSSGHVFVSSASKNNKNVIVVTIKDTDRFKNHEYLYEKTFSKYDSYLVLDQYNFFIDEGKNAHYYIKNDFRMLLTDDEKDKVTSNAVLYRKSNNNIAGYIEVKLKGNIVYKQNIYVIYKDLRRSFLKSLLSFLR